MGTRSPVTILGALSKSGKHLWEVLWLCIKKLSISSPFRASIELSCIYLLMNTKLWSHLGYLKLIIVIRVTRSVFAITIADELLRFHLN